MRRVLFYVQHLLGVGHVRRAEILTNAMAARGLDVTVAFGGKPFPAIPFRRAELVHLPPAIIHGVDFKTIRDAGGVPVTDDWKAARRDLLLTLYDRVRPGVVLTEMFPFGRRQFRFELVPLLRRAREDGGATAASVRDILVASTRTSRDDEKIAFARDLFDRILVHADPAVVPFETTFPRAAEIADLVRYTGFVTEPVDATAGPVAENGEVIVSAGGGAAGAPLLLASAQARRAGLLQDRTWRFLAGPNLPDAAYRALEAFADERTIVERFRPDFQRLLAGAALSISQGGYNTVMNLLRTGVPSVVAPIAEDEETEQRVRAERLAAMGLMKVLPPGPPSVEAIIAAATRARRPAGAPAIDVEGAAATARLVEDLAARTPLARRVDA